MIWYLTILIWNCLESVTFYWFYSSVIDVHMMWLIICSSTMIIIGRLEVWIPPLPHWLNMWIYESAKLKLGIWFATSTPPLKKHLLTKTKQNIVTGVIFNHPRNEVTGPQLSPNAWFIAIGFYDWQMAALHMSQCTSLYWVNCPVNWTSTLGHNTYHNDYIDYSYMNVLIVNSQTLPWTWSIPMLWVEHAATKQWFSVSIYPCSWLCFQFSQVRVHKELKERPYTCTEWATWIEYIVGQVVWATYVIY